jgi:hypothetical protein
MALSMAIFCSHGVTASVAEETTEATRAIETTLR